MSDTRRQSKSERLADFEVLVSEYERPLLRYVGLIVYDRDAAQDVVQDAFIRLFRKWPEEMAPSARLSSWLYRVAHNLAVDYLRKESRLHLLHRRHAEDHEDSAPPDRGRAFRISEEAEKAVGALRGLSLREQQLVVLKVFEEKSYKEISQITGLTVSNVGYILHHAMKKMAAVLKKERAI